MAAKMICHLYEYEYEYENQKSPNKAIQIEMRNQSLSQADISCHLAKQS